MIIKPWQAAILAIILLGVITPVTAHKRNHPFIRITLDPLPPALQGIQVQLYDRIAPQVLLANPTAAVIEVMDLHGNAFLRISATQVTANQVSSTWYESYFPDGVAAQPGLAVLGAALPALWKPVAQDNSWGWYDPRLDASQFTIPPATDRMQRTLGRWQIPLQINGEATALSGEFRYEPPPAGVLHTELITAYPQGSEVRFTIVQGRYPALFVESHAAQPIMLLDRNNIAFLSIGPDHVYANPHSVGWRHSGRAATHHKAGAVLSPTVAGCVVKPADHWIKVANTSRYSYIEPRLHQPNGRPTTAVVAAGKPAVLAEWEIPYCYQGVRKQLLGFNWWQPQSSKPER